VAGKTTHNYLLSVVVASVAVCRSSGNSDSLRRGGLEITVVTRHCNY
jgi:hypothetical protein